MVMLTIGDKTPITVGDALAQQIEVRRGPASPWVEALHELGALDLAVYDAVARTPTDALDGPIRRLSEAANYSRLWLGLAGVIAVFGGRQGATRGARGCRLDWCDIGHRQPWHQEDPSTETPGTRRGPSRS